MTILRLSAFSLALAISVISLGFTNPAFAAKPNCQLDPSHPSCNDDGGADGITYTAELQGALVFGPLDVTLEGQDERLKAWRRKQSPLFVAQCPGVRPDQRGVRDTFLQRLDYGDCLGDLVRVCELILKRWPHKHLVVTVSPVALHRTFTAADHSVANCESKSILRAAAGELTHQFDHVHYFHSYEMCLLNPPQTVFEADGRHIQRSFIDEIVTTFLDQFGSQTLHRLPAEQAPPASGARPAHQPIPQ